MLGSVVDGATATQESSLRKIPGRPPVTTLVDYQGFCGFSAGTADGDNDEEEEEEGFQRVSPQEVVERMEGGWTPYVLDVRYTGIGTDVELYLGLAENLAR